MPALSGNAPLSPTFTHIIALSWVFVHEPGKESTQLLRFEVRPWHRNRSCVPDQTDKPSSVRGARPRGNHLSRTTVTRCLKRPTRGARGESPRRQPWLSRPLLDLAPDGVCLAGPVTRTAGGLLHHRFTLACHLAAAGNLLSVALCRRVTPPGCYPASYSVELGLSSDRVAGCPPPARDCLVCSGTTIVTF